MRSAVIMVLALGGCSTIVPQTTAPNDIMAKLTASDGSDRGQAILRISDGRMRLTVNAVGLTPGPRGIHIHEVGRCDAPGFVTAKGHWNPAMKAHGRDNPMGAHDGDLTNLMVGADGRGTASLDVPGSVAALLDADGASVLIHADADDYRTDPSGNSGARIACGVLTVP
jgi:superoxide dismutase, Cu-Zn family